MWIVLFKGIVFHLSFSHWTDQTVDVSQASSNMIVVTIIYASVKNMYLHLLLYQIIKQFISMLLLQRWLYF